MEKPLQFNPENEKKEILKREIITNVFGGKDVLQQLVKEWLNSSEVKSVSRKLNDQEVARLVLRSVNTEGYEYGTCLEVAREAVRKARNLLKGSEKRDSLDFKSLAKQSRRFWKEEARRAGFGDEDEEYRKFLKEN